ncbi:hypothetical protein [Rhizobium sp. L1K21]|uniref:hypothetical protein n=1 Tax=Rhizobium sp. L1K21 TaxID=2954933 RepID=UPI00209338DC|nr:hypothetical protein [Rhizobium sp. L1K21]MCO6188288.1 hypothetical protein [Rhizobium sp. L1K21]
MAGYGRFCSVRLLGGFRLFAEAKPALAGRLPGAASNLISCAGRCTAERRPFISQHSKAALPYAGPAFLFSDRIHHQKQMQQTWAVEGSRGGRTHPFAAFW